MQWRVRTRNTCTNVWRFICFCITKVGKSCVSALYSVRSWINTNSRATLSRDYDNIKIDYPQIKELPPVPLWIIPKTRQKAIQRAKDRANEKRWDLDTAVFLFGIVAILLILAYEGVGIWITTPISTFGLIMVWLVGFKKARQSYEIYLQEELARYPDEWKDYYKILHINPGAKPEEIVVAHDRLSIVLKDIQSAEGSTLAYSNILSDAKEAYQVLCDPHLKATYDYIYWSLYNAETNIDPEFKKELIELSQSIYKEVVKRSSYSTWTIPSIDKIPPRVSKAIISFVLAVLLIGTTLAFAKPENVLAAPFRSVASTIAQVSTGVVELFNSSRSVAANAELKTISTVLQSMRVDESLKLVPPVVTPTNDMAFFPSREFCLYPEYLEKRYSQFKYTVNSKGIMTVDTSWAITDELLQYMLQVIERIERIE